MKLPITINILRLSTIFVFMFMVYSCASSGSLIASDQLIIKKIPADNMHIGYVYVENNKGSTEISGRVRFNRRMLGIPSDYLDVTIVNPGGKVLYSARSRYYRNGKPNRELDMFSFSLIVPNAIPNGSTILLEDDKS